MFTTETVLFAFALTLIAGLSTGIGSILAFFTKKTNTNFLSVSLGFSAGVMIYVSFVEILPEATHSLEELYHGMAEWIATAGFFGGIALIAIIDKWVPSKENPHEVRKVEQISKADKNHKLMRLGVFTALAITIHNFPEGIATFVSALNDPGLGLAIAIAIAIHNIPEGIAVSVPIYYSTNNKRKAFWYSFFSGLAEPFGAFVAYLFLMPYLGSSGAIMGISLAAVAGIMVFISIDELLPTAEEYGQHHLSIYGLVAGMGVMALSLLLI